MFADVVGAVAEVRLLIRMIAVMNRDIKVDTAAIDGQGRCAWIHPCNQRRNQRLATQLQSRLCGRLGGMGICALQYLYLYCLVRAEQPSYCIYNSHGNSGGRRGAHLVEQRNGAASGSNQGTVVAVVAIGRLDAGWQQDGRRQTA